MAATALAVQADEEEDYLEIKPMSLPLVERVRSSDLGQDDWADAVHDDMALPPPATSGNMQIEDGYSAREVFASPGSRGYTFQDMIVLPGHIDFGVDDVELTTRVTRRVRLNVPVCSSPMDTVTEAEMAIAMALQGGVGFIHCRCTISEQVKMVKGVKSFQNGFISNPQCCSPDSPLSDLDKIKEESDITGLPVTADGNMGSRLVGFVTDSDSDFVENRSTTVGDVMTPLETGVVTALHPCALDEAYETIKREKAKYLCVVDDQNNLKALTTRADLIKNRDFPMQIKDKNTNSLICGAAVTTGPDGRERADALVGVGVDIIVVDSRNGDTAEQVTMLEWLKATHPGVEVVAGNVASHSQVKRLLDAGADGIRIGMGVGSISTSQEVKAVGRAQLSAIYHCAKLARQYDVPVIADGGVATPGSVSKALAMGASCVMMGSMLAGVEESPGAYYYAEGMRLKTYRGMDSLYKTQAESAQDHNTAHPLDLDSPAPTAAVGVSGAVVEKGSMRTFMPYISQSLRHGLQDMGYQSLPKLREALYSGNLRFEIRSPNAQREGGVHDLHSYQTRLYASK